jgi:A/G-specific adenine glycosylase
MDPDVANNVLSSATGMRPALIRWYKRAKRDLPWRRTRDPYAIWISEIMLQQTRVAAVIPYYERFMAAFPDAQALAAAPESTVLAMWSGLGYYSRARNLQKAARQISSAGFPRDFGSLRALAGIGDYTAAAISSIAFGLPHAVVDGNVRRVIVRLLNQNDAAVQQEADRLLDRADPGRWNQALMELGATICRPRDPVCDECPLTQYCGARSHGTQEELPAKRVKPAPVRLERTLLMIRRGTRILLVPSPRVKGFWDLPEEFAGVRVGKAIGEFRHTITHRRYRFQVRHATAKMTPDGSKWWSREEVDEIPLSTTTRKALQLLARQTPR